MVWRNKNESLACGRCRPCGTASDRMRCARPIGIRRRRRGGWGSCGRSSTCGFAGTGSNQSPSRLDQTLAGLVDDQPSIRLAAQAAAYRRLAGRCAMTVCTRIHTMARCLLSSSCGSTDSAAAREASTSALPMPPGCSMSISRWRRCNQPMRIPGRRVARRSGSPSHRGICVRLGKSFGSGRASSRANASRHTGSKTCIIPIPPVAARSAHTSALAAAHHVRLARYQHHYMAVTPIGLYGTAQAHRLRHELAHEIRECPWSERRVPQQPS